MSIQKLIQESIAGNPLEMKEALVEELKERIAEALAAKMEEANLDESVSFKKTDSGDHHIHHNGKPVGRITKTSSMGSNGYSVRIGGNTAKHEVGTESSLAAAKDSAKWHITSSESPVNMKEEVKQIDESEGRQIVDKLKSTGEHEEAGKMAFKHGLGRSYGPHFGMRSSKYSAETAYHKGYDKAEFAGRKKTNEEVNLDEAGDIPSHQYYATTQYINRSEMKMLHDKKKPFATEKEAFEHIKKQGGRQDGTIHKVSVFTGRIVSNRHVAAGQAGYVSDVGRGDPKNVSELPK
jgi:hypothetical protein